IRSSPSIGADGTIYFGSYDGWLYAVHPDGTERWSVGLHCGLPWGCQPVSSSPSIGPDGTIYIVAGNLYAVDPGGSIAWDFRPGCEVIRAPLLAANGNVHVGMITLEAQGHRVWDYGTGTRIHGCGSSAIG